MGQGRFRDSTELTIHGVGSASGGTYENIRIHGTGRIGGDVICGLVDVHGLVTVHGKAKAGDVRIHGRCKVDGALTAGELRLEGTLSVGGDCSAERIICHGAIAVQGLLNAEHIEMDLAGPSKATEIGGRQVIIRGTRGFFRRSRMLTVGMVEGDEVYLENTKADVVRGNRVTLGSGCDVGLVEYQAAFDRRSDAKVREHRQN